VSVPNVYLLGYRSARLTWDFHPQDISIFDASVDACHGRFELVIKSLTRCLRVVAQKEDAQEAFQLAGPTRSGFQEDSVESYHTRFTVQAYSGFDHAHFEEELSFIDGALEFGGTAQCNHSRVQRSRLGDFLRPQLERPTFLSQQMPRRRIRREIRSLSEDQRERVFAAMNIMKATDGSPGRVRYGDKYFSYDELVAQHLSASAHSCDRGHLGPAFATYHRALALRFEEALIAVDPNIEALPYWDYNLEAQLPDPYASKVFTEWFGSIDGEPTKGHAVSDGRFAHWRIRSAAWDISNLTSPYGLLRSPWNVNPSTRLTRSKFACGTETVLTTSAWNRCLDAASFLLWYACIDPTVHTWAHSFLGGIWDVEGTEARVSCFLKNALLIPNAWTHGCLRCSQNCTDPQEAQRSCSCNLSPSSLPCALPRIFTKTAPTFGDFADAWTSPNDPIFFFHHANVDRHLMTWQQQNSEKAPTYGYPTISLPCTGHGLQDVVAATNKFTRNMLGLKGDGLLTNADLIAVDGLSSQSSYTYDTLWQEEL